MSLSPCAEPIIPAKQRILFVDGTHGLTAYGYQVLTIMVVDRNGNGLAVGWSIASRENHKTWELTARSLRRESLDCEPEVMMSDDTNSAWNGLTRVWKTLKHKLLCHWHVGNNVKAHCCGAKAADPVVVDNEAGKERKCIRIIPKKTYGVSAWEFFQSLMKETNETEFRRLMELLKSNLVQHNQMKLLAYLEKFYFTEERLKQWTMWYRQKMYNVEWIANSNMFVEAWHSVLKTHILGRKKNTRVDTLLQALMQAENRFFFKWTRTRLGFTKHADPRWLAMRPQEPAVTPKERMTNISCPTPVPVPPQPAYFGAARTLEKVLTTRLQDVNSMCSQVCAGLWYEGGKFEGVVWEVSMRYVSGV